MKLFIVLILMFVSTVAFGQDVYPDEWVPVDPVFVPPTWLESFLLLLNGLPVVGPILVKASQWAGVLAVVTTSLAGSLIVSVRALSTVLTAANLVAWVPKIENVANPLIYWLKYISMFNVQKKK